MRELALRVQINRVVCAASAALAVAIYACSSPKQPRPKAPELWGDLKPVVSVKELWDAGENLDQACENCHLEYWYPGEKAYLRKLDQHLEEMFGHRPGRTASSGPAR